MFESVDFEEPWRPVHEWPMALSWLAASAITLAVTATLPVPNKAGVLAAIGCLGVAAWRTKQALERGHARKRAVEKTRKQFITAKDLTTKLKEGRFWLGRGFTWTDIEARKMHALIGKGVAETFGKEFISDGAHWLHGLAREEDVYAELSLLEGHTLIVGSTGVGKTRLFDSLAIIKKDRVIETLSSMAHLRRSAPLYIVCEILQVKSDQKCTPLPRSLGERLKVWRDHLGLNQQQFADLLKMNIGTLRKYELSINLPGSEALAAFGTTGVSLDWLVLGRGEMRAQPSESGDVEWKGKLEALKEVVASLDEERRSVVLDDAIARARDAIRMARLERIVQELNQRFG